MCNLYDIVISNGCVIDTSQAINGIRNVGINGHKISTVTDKPLNAEFEIDATDCLVLPGLIDFHTHLYYGGSEYGLKPDYLLSQGVTAAVDAGTSGSAGFESFYHSIILNSSLHIRAFLSIGATGLSDPNHHQNYEYSNINIKKLKLLKERYPNQILGLKVAMSKRDVGELRLQPLRSAISIAEEIGNLSVCVHSTNPPCDIENLISEMRPGDILCHCYHGTGSSIIDENNMVKKEILKARERGVIFDIANGISHCSHKVTQNAIIQKFLPDIISSDIVSFAYGRSKRNKCLPYVMSKMLEMGMNLNDVVRAVTEVPAKMMHMENQIGTLKSGSWADISILKLENHNVAYEDADKEYYYGNKLLVPKMTIRNGQVTFCQIDFNNISKAT